MTPDTFAFPTGEQAFIYLGQVRFETRSMAVALYMYRFSLPPRHRAKSGRTTHAGSRATPPARAANSTSSRKEAFEGTPSRTGSMLGEALAIGETVILMTTPFYPY